MSSERRFGQQVMVVAAAAVVAALVVAVSIIVGVRVTLSSLKDAQDDPSHSGASGATGASTTELATGTGAGNSAAPIRLSDVVPSAAPHETVRLRGQAPTYGVEQTLRVQLRGRHGWITFPLPTVTDWLGHFTAYVELGRPGPNRLRVVDPTTGSVSDVVTVTVGKSAPAPTG